MRGGVIPAPAPTPRRSPRSRFRASSDGIQAATSRLLAGKTQRLTDSESEAHNQQDHERARDPRRCESCEGCKHGPPQRSESHNSSRTEPVGQAAAGALKQAYPSTKRWNTHPIWMWSR